MIFRLTYFMWIYSYTRSLSWWYYTSYFCIGLCIIGYLDTFLSTKTTFHSILQNSNFFAFFLSSHTYTHNLRPYEYIDLISGYKLMLLEFYSTQMKSIFIKKFMQIFICTCTYCIYLFISLYLIPIPSGKNRAWRKKKPTKHILSV